MLTLSGPNGKQEAVGLLSDAHKQISELLHAMPTTAVQPVQKYGLVGAIEHLINDEFPNAFDADNEYVPLLEGYPSTCPSS